MASLIEQIQLEALNPEAPVGTLLRKMKLAAAKLQLDNIEDWVQKELSGYDGDVPKYREVVGRPVAFNPYRGWIPITGQIAESLSSRQVGQSIPALEDVLAGGRKGELQMPFPPAITEWLDRHSSISFGRYTLMLDRGSAVNIVETVRNLILDWSIEMEKAGVTGDGLTFSPSEKVKAQKSTSHTTINNYGTFAGNVGTGNTSGDIFIGKIDISKAVALGEQIEGYLPSLAKEGIDISEIKNRIDLIGTEANKKRPAEGVVRGALTDIRNSLSGATGSILASGIITAITAFLG